MVMVLPAKEAFTPAGKLVGVPMPVAPVVVWVILVSAVLIQRVGVDEAAPAVLAGVSVTELDVHVVDSLPAIIITCN